MILYEFRTRILSGTRTPPQVVKASRRELERFIPLDEFGPLFGGYVLWNTPDLPTDEMPGDGLGVWGSRNAARLRRILRERGATITLVRGPGSDQTFKAVYQDHRDHADANRTGDASP